MNNITFVALDKDFWLKSSIFVFLLRIIPFHSYFVVVMVLYTLFAK